MTAQITADMLSPSQAALRLEVSAARVRQMVNEGKLPATMTALGRLIPAEAVEKLRQEREAKNVAA